MESELQMNICCILFCFLNTIGSNDAIDKTMNMSYGIFMDKIVAQNYRSME